MGGRAVEGTGLENRQTCKGLVGSNPTPSTMSNKLLALRTAHFTLMDEIRTGEPTGLASATTGATGGVSYCLYSGT